MLNRSVRKVVQACFRYRDFFLYSEKIKNIIKIYNKNINGRGNTCVS